MREVSGSMSRAPAIDATLLSGQLADWLASAVPIGIAAAAGRIKPSLPFDDAEEAAIVHAVESRQDEFRTGRRLARVALARLGRAATSLAADADGVPCWPEAYIGGISHSGGLCVALAGLKRHFIGIGVDIEVIGRPRLDLAPLFCRPEELAQVEAEGTPDAAILRFSAKEAFYKAYFPATRHFLDFQDLRVDLDLAAGRFEAQLMHRASPTLGGQRTFVGSFLRLGRLIATILWIARPSCLGAS
jgi:4'-phosphopantetheinyl transferase EntD